jgi:RNA polymerase sigma-70 factor (ECF subfamily)
MIADVPEDQITVSNTSIETLELQLKIEAAIASLPEKCRMVFELNRIEGLKYAEIAEKMNISIKTVEAQMSKALAVMKDHLSEFMTLIFIFWT